MIFELITIFLLLFIINGLIYQFMYDIYLWVGILSLAFYLIYLSINIIIWRKRKKQQTILTKEKTPAQTATVQENITKNDKQEMSLKKIESKEQKKEIPKEDKDLKVLQEFISKNLKQGFKPEVIKQALLKQGWPKEKIEQAFK